MADREFWPIRAEAVHTPGHDGAVILTDRDGNRLIIDMPNMADAEIAAAAMNNAFQAAGRQK